MTLPRPLPSWSELGPNRQFARDLLRIFGSEFTLPDNTTVRLIIDPTPKSEDNTEWIEYVGYIPNDVAYTGTLNEEQTIRLGSATGTPYFVADLHRQKNGWLEVDLIHGMV